MNTKIQCKQFNNKLFLISAKDGFINKLPIFFLSNKLDDDLILINKQTPNNIIVINLPM